MSQPHAGNQDEPAYGTPTAPLTPGAGPAPASEAPRTDGTQQESQPTPSIPPQAWPAPHGHEPTRAYEPPTTPDLPQAWAAPQAYEPPTAPGQPQAWGAQPGQPQAWGAQPGQPQAWGAQPGQPQAWGAQPATTLGQPQAWGTQPGQPQAWGAQPEPAHDAGVNQAYGQPAAYGTLPAYGAYSPPISGELQPYDPAAVSLPQAYPPPVAYAPAATGTVVTAGGRFAGLLLDGVLILVTLWIGWLIWSFFTWANGQTPAKQLLGHVVADANTGEAFGWGRMFLREFVVKAVLGYLINSCSFGVYGLVDAFMVFGERRQTAHDKMVDSIVRYR